MKKESPQMNIFLEVQIRNQIMEVDNFMKLCRIAAKKDDGVIDDVEAKILKKINRKSKRYIKSLRKLTLLKEQEDAK